MGRYLRAECENDLVIPPSSFTIDRGAAGVARPCKNGSTDTHHPLWAEGGLLPSELTLPARCQVPPTPSTRDRLLLENAGLTVRGTESRQLHSELRCKREYFRNANTVKSATHVFVLICFWVIATLVNMETFCKHNIR